MRRRTIFQRGALRLATAGFALVPTVAARAQISSGADDRALQRESRLRELEQLGLDNRLRANQNIPPDQRLLIDYGGFFTFSYLSLDDSVSNNHVLRQYDVFGYARVNLDGAQEFFARGRWGYRDFHRGDSFDGRGDEPVDGDLDRGYYRFDLQRFTGSYYGTPSDIEFVFQGGRDLAYWANGLVLGQVLDGVFINLGNEVVSIDAVAGVTPTRTVDFDTSRPNFDHNTRRGFYGGMVTLTGGEHRPFVYGLVQRDYNEDDLLDFALTRTEYEYDSYYLGFGSVGNLSERLRYGVEMAFEGGHNRSNSFEISPSGLAPVNQSVDNIVAFAFDLKLDYLLDDPNQTRLSAELIGATGDDDRGATSSTFNGNARGTHDNAFNAFGLLNTGLAFSPQVSNLFAVRLGAATFPLPQEGPFKRLQVGTDFFVFMKLDKSAPIDEPTIGSNRYLGVEPDVYLNWQITSDVTLSMRYGVFFPSADSFQVEDARQFFFTGVTFAF